MYWILELPLRWFLMAFYHPFGGAGFRWPIHSIIGWWFTRLFDVIPILFVILVAQTFHALLAFSLASWFFSGWCFCHPSEHCSKLCVSPLYWLVQYRVPSSWIMIIPNYTYLSNSRVLAATARYYPNIGWWRPNFWVNHLKYTHHITIYPRSSVLLYWINHSFCWGTSLQDGAPQL